MSACNVPGCTRPHHARGWCNTHYQRVKLRGSVDAGRQEWDLCRPTAVDRFWIRVAKTDHCWYWMGGRVPSGYGTFYGTYAHRFSYELAHGTIPDGHEVCHTCDVPSCVRPEHLYLATHRENMRDAVRKGRFHGNAQCGEAHGNTRLTDAQVIEIRQSHEKTCDIARRLGIHRSVVGDARRRKTFKHLPK